MRCPSYIAKVVLEIILLSEKTVYSPKVNLLEEPSQRHHWVKVNITAAGNNEYKAATKTVTLTIKVK